MMDNIQNQNDLFYLDNCTVCGKPASKACGSCESVYYCSREHQKQDWNEHKLSCKKYELKDTEIQGTCMVAIKPINPGQLIAVEYPLAVYRRVDTKDTSDSNNLGSIFDLSNATAYICLSCDTGKVFSATHHRCTKCNMPLCSSVCETSGTHGQMECPTFQKHGVRVSENVSNLHKIFTDVIILRTFLKQEKSGCAISFENRRWANVLKMASEMSPEEMGVQSVRDRFPLCWKIIQNENLVNAVACVIKRYGVTFPHIASRTEFLFEKLLRTSHSCVPNAAFWIEGGDTNHKLIMKGIRPINPGDIITVNKARKYAALPTMERRKKLLELGIDCHCQRCKDPTELGTFVSAIRCEDSLTSKSCKGFYVPENPFNSQSRWKCTLKACIKSHKGSQEIHNLLNTLREELPIVNGRADEILKSFKHYLDYYGEDVFSPNNYMLRTVHCRIRQVLKRFLSPAEKMILCVLNEYPKAYDFCLAFMRSVDSIWDFVDKTEPLFSECRGFILYEKTVTRLTLTLYDYLVLQNMQTLTLVSSLKRTCHELKEVLETVSIFTHPLVQSLRDNVNFLLVLVSKMAQGKLNKGTDANPGKDAVENSLRCAFYTWKSKAKSVGLSHFYMEPAFKPISTVDLRNILVSAEV